MTVFKIRQCCYPVHTTNINNIFFIVPILIYSSQPFVKFSNSIFNKDHFPKINKVNLIVFFAQFKAHKHQYSIAFLGIQVTKHSTKYDRSLGIVSINVPEVKYQNSYFINF